MSFELSRSAPLNELIRAAQASAENPDDPDLSRELNSRLKFMVVFIDQLRQQYKASRELRRPTALMRQLDPEIKREMEQLRTALKRVQRGVDERRPEHVAGGCAEARQAADTLLLAFDKLRGEEETFPVYSSSPPVNELINVAMGVVEGHIPEEQLRVRLEGFYNHWKRTMADAEEWQKSPAENEEVAAQLPRVKVEMEQMKKGLREMSRYFSDGEKSHLRKGADIVARASEALLELRKTVLESLVPAVSCPRCAAKSPPGSKMCTGCGARLPELVSGASSTMEVRAEAPGQPRFAYVARLEEAVEACLEGRLSARDLRPTVEWFAANVRQGKRTLDALKPPPQFPSEEMRRGAEETRALMEQASGALIQGVERLEAYFVDSAREHLDEGLSLVRRGTALMFEAQERMRMMGVGAPR